jgi:hypothetical protein
MSWFVMWLLLTSGLVVEQVIVHHDDPATVEDSTNETQQ